MLFQYATYATRFPTYLAGWCRCALAPDRLRNRAAGRGQSVSCDGLSPARSSGSAGEGFVVEAKYLCDGGRSFPDGGGVFGWYFRQADAEGQLHDLFKTGTQTFRVVWIQRAGQSGCSFHWWRIGALCRLSDGLLV